MGAKRVMVVEDEAIVAKDLGMQLARLGYAVTDIVANGADAISSATRHCPDIALMDIRIRGGMDGIETAQILRNRFDVPVVFLTAFADDETVRRAAITHPLGYVLKPFTANDLRASLAVALHNHDMERALRRREHWFATTLGAIGDAVVATDRDGVINFANLAARLLTGLAQEQLLGRHVDEAIRLIADGSDEPLENPIVLAMRERKIVLVPAGSMLATPAGNLFIDDSAAPIIDDTGELLGAVLVFRDVTERRTMMAQLALADRLSSLGTLAAGVAHEINNPLAIVVADADDIEQQLIRVRSELADDGSGPRTYTVHRDLGDLVEQTGELRDAAMRIQRIVADLRAYSRPQDDPASVALDDAVTWAVRVTSAETRF